MVRELMCAKRKTPQRTGIAPHPSLELVIDNEVCARAVKGNVH